MAITGATFSYVMMIFVDGGNLPTLGNILTASVNNYKKNQDV